MTLERFAKLVAAHGAALTRWPQADQAGARRLLAASPQAVALLADAAALDALLDQLPEPEPSAALMTRLSSAVEARLDAEAAALTVAPDLAARSLAARGRGGEGGVGRPAAFAGLFLAMIALGFVAGLAGLDPWPTQHRATTAPGLLALIDPMATFNTQ